MNDLTEKERRFVEEYLTNNFNAGKAAKDAGYSEKSKYFFGHELLKNPKIKAYVDAFMREGSLEKLELLKRLSDIARNVGSEYMSADGDVDLDALLEDGYGHVIKKVRKSRLGKKWVEFYDSAKALEQIAKIYNLINDGANITVSIDERITAEQELNQKLKELDVRLKKDYIIMPKPTEPA